MNIQAFRGVSFEYPENTLTALIGAWEQGYQSVSVDVTATADGALVLMAGTDISAVAVRMDGRPLEKTLCVNALPFAELINYDFGVRWGNKFKDTPVCVLREALQLAKRTNMQVTVDPHDLTAEQMEKLYNVLEGYDSMVALRFSTPEELASARERLPNIPLHYRGTVSEDNLQKLSEIKVLTVWLNPDAPEALVRQITTFARLGVGMVTEYTQLERAEELGAAVVETSGHIKNAMNQGVLSDLHVHSHNSHDAYVPIMDMCKANMDAGVTVVGIADHCDLFLCEDEPDADVYSNLLDCYEEIRQVNEQLGDRCKVLMGVELGEAIWHPAQCAKVIKTVPFDCVVGSVHALHCKWEGDYGLKHAFSQFPWANMTLEQAHEVFALYFEDLLKMVSVADVDVVAHLTTVTAYYNRHHNTVVDLHRYEPIIREILKVIIHRHLTLEVNTGNYVDKGITRPEKWILEIYRELGGYLITMGTDSHGKNRVAIGYPGVVQMLKDIGFRHTVYFEKRRTYQLTL